MNYNIFFLITDSVKVTLFGGLFLVLTPFHYPLAYLIYRSSKRKLSIETLSFGAFLPDIEIPVLFLIGVHPTRRVLHSIIGSLFLAPLVSVLLYKIYLIFLYGNWRDSKFKFNIKWLLGIELGSISHVFLDALHHSYNPLLWPLTDASFDYFVLFGNWYIATYILQTLFFISTMYMFLREFLIQNKNPIAAVRSLLSTPHF